MIGRKVLVAGVACSIACFAVPGVAADVPTIGDLKPKKPAVRVDQPKGGSADLALRNYQDFVALQNADPGLRAEALRRLADLKLEASERDRIERELQPTGSLTPRDAIDLYTRLLAEFPAFDHADAVYYQLARAYDAAQLPAQSLDTLEALVKRYPDSHLVDEANFRRGEELFSTRRWQEADKAYSAVVAAGDRSEFFQQSLYKQGWSRFKAGAADDALDSFARLLDRLLVNGSGEVRNPEKFPRPRRELLDDVLRVTAIILAADDGPRTLDHFMGRRGNTPYAHYLYATLGDLYVAKQRYTDAAEAYAAFAKRFPQHDEAPILDEKAIDAYRDGGFTSLVLAAKKDYVDRYRFEAPYWRGRAPDQMPRVVDELKRNIGDLAAYYHAEAQRDKKPSDLDEAARWYREFLHSFPNDPGAAGINYLLADTLFEAGHFAGAAQEFEATAYNYPRGEKSANAGYAALVAYDAAGKQESTTDAAARDTSKTTSALRFATTFPDHPEAANVLAKTARELYDAKQYPRAIEAADLLLARSPAPASAMVRDTLMVKGNSEFELGSFADAEVAYTGVRAIGGVTAEVDRAVGERLAASVYKQAEARRVAGDDLGAADEFLRVAQVAPDAKVASAALYDGAALLLAHEEWQRAISVLETYRSRYGSADKSSEVSRRLATAYLKADRLPDAAREFAGLGGDVSLPAEAQREALSQAAELYGKVGDRDREIATLTDYVRRFPQPLDAAMEARATLAAELATRGETAGHSALLSEMIAADASGGSARTARTRQLAAGAALELADRQRDRFREIRLTIPLRKSLEVKKTALQAALHAYQVADGYAVTDVSTSATYEMAELYRQLGRDLMGSERPKGLGGDELEQYSLLLEEQAYPFEEKAIAIHLVNTERVPKGVYDAHVRQSFAVLAELLPARFAKTERHVELVAELKDPAQSPEAQTRFAGAVVGAAEGRLEEGLVNLQNLAAQGMADPALGQDIGVLLARLGRWADAEAALAVVPGPDAIGERAITLRNLGRFEEAEKCYREALVQSPDDLVLHVDLGILLDLYLQQPVAALAEFAAARTLTQGEDKQLDGWIAELKPRAARAGTSAPKEPQ